MNEYEQALIEAIKTIHVLIDENRELQEKRDDYHRRGLEEFIRRYTSESFLFILKATDGTTLEGITKTSTFLNDKNVLKKYRNCEVVSVSFDLIPGIIDIKIREGSCE